MSRYFVRWRTCAVSRGASWNRRTWPCDSCGARQQRRFARLQIAKDLTARGPAHGFGRHIASSACASSAIGLARDHDDGVAWSRESTRRGQRSGTSRGCSRPARDRSSLAASGAAEKVVRLVEQDLVRQAGAAPQRHSRGSSVSRYLALSWCDIFDRSMTTLTSGWRSARASSRALRRRIVAAEHDDARQRFERPIVALGIDDAHAVALQDQLLAQQARQPRLAGARLAGDQNRAAAHGEADRRRRRADARAAAAGGPSARRTAAAAATRAGCSRRRPAGPVPGIDFVGDRAQRGAAPGDRDADLARVEQIVIVLRVADADGVVNRDAAARAAPAEGRSTWRPPAAGPSGGRD